MTPDDFFAAVEERQIAQMPWYDDYTRACRRDPSLYAPKSLDAVPCRICGKPVEPHERTKYGHVHRECFNANEREKRRTYMREYQRAKRAEARA